MYNTITSTSTYTRLDIKKAFEGFEADLRMIARRTNKWTVEKTEHLLHDVIKWAEAEYLHSLNIVLMDSNSKPLRATKFTVNSTGTAMNSDRAGGNDWADLPNTNLTLIVYNSNTWHQLTEAEREKFKQSNGFKSSWGPTSIDTTFSHLSKSDAQLYASKGFEVQKQNYK